VPLADVAACDSTRAYVWVGIIDDDVSVRVALSRVFRTYDIDVETFGSADEYLSRATLTTPACIVLDVHLGASSGFDLQEFLVSLGYAPPIIFISADDDIPAVRCSRFAGTSGYLRKPFDTDLLIGLVRPHLSASTDSSTAHHTSSKSPGFQEPSNAGFSGP
jgi:FixJ family two-component response regulator